MNERMTRLLRREVPGWVQERLDRQHKRIEKLERELERVAPQVAALEQRLAALETRTATTSPPQDAPGILESGDPTAAELLEAVRAEHARVRARVSAATRYEERLRALEDRIGAATD